MVKKFSVHKSAFELFLDDLQMIGFNPNDNSKNKTSLKVLLAGTTSGFVCRAVVQPLDVLKIRFQLQVEPIKKHSSASKYRSMRQAFVSIYKEEGAKAFWKSHVPSQIHTIAFSASQFLLFETFSKVSYVAATPSMRNSVLYLPASDFSCGLAAGICSCCFTCLLYTSPSPRD